MRSKGKKGNYMLWVRYCIVTTMGGGGGGGGGGGSFRLVSVCVTCSPLLALARLCMVEVVLDDPVFISLCGCMFGRVVQSLNANSKPSNSQGVSLPHAATWRPGALGVLVCACVA